MPKSANRLKRLPPYIFVTIAEQIRKIEAEGHSVIRLDIGNPDMPPPPNVVEALSNSVVKPNKHGYSGYRGVAEFRQAVADYYQKRFDVVVDSNTEVLPLIGSKEGILNLILAHIDETTTALIPDISYPAYEMGVRMAGGQVAFMPLEAENGFLIDFDLISDEMAEKANLMWINYPNNPTGAVADKAFYQKAVGFCSKHDILLASDNPYVEILYGDYIAGSVLQIEGAKDIAVEFMSFSKTYNMAGWRLGAAVGNADALKNLLHVKSNMDSGHFKAVYDAGIAALTETPQTWIDERNLCYQHRRDQIMAVLPKIGLEARTPEGAMYIWAKVLDMKAEEYVHNALTKAHVSIAPGAAYGPGGESYVRLSVGIPDKTLEGALDRLQQWYNA